ncbi:hypothetical protein PPS11_29173 [Pseudomonas putida S11]|nr:hypothetical protein PPS11_29173 [Pseudomonas putida S11]
MPYASLACGLSRTYTGFIDPRHQLAGAVADIDLQTRQALLAGGSLLADFVQQRVIDVEFGIHRAFARRNEIDAGGLVPDDVVTPQLLDQQQHVERVDHAVQAAAALGADVVAVPAGQLHRHLDAAQVRADVLYADTSAEVRREQVQPPAQQARPARQPARVVTHA